MSIAAGCFSRAALCQVRCLPFVGIRGIHARRQPARRPVTPAASGAAPLSTAAPKFSTLSSEQQQQVEAYLDILLEWNQNMNLTAIRDRGEAYERHVNDSLALLPAIDRCLAAQQQARQQQEQQQQQKKQEQQRQQLRPAASSDEDAWQRGGTSASSSSRSSSKGSPVMTPETAAAAVAGPPRLIDVGSGAGLPGIILAIARPDWEVTLLDSLQKRCKFNEAAIQAAGLSNVRVHWARAEEAGQDPSLRQQYDASIARAVAELRVLAELCLPLVRPGGHWVAAKGAAPQEEVAVAQGAIGKLGGKLLGVEEVDSESPEGRRTAVVVLKARQTPAQYPRKPGVPSKKPL